MYRLSQHRNKSRHTVADPFAAVPMLPPNMEMRTDSRGMLRVRLHQEATGFLRKVARVLGYRYTREIELDEQGTLYFKQIDGRKTLREIVAAMCDQMRGDPKETAGRVILFTKKLMTMNMILLKVPQLAEKRRA
jgi:hypothetical protein